MLRSALAKIRTHLVITVASAVCMIVAVVALGFTVYNALCLLVIPVAASALTTVIFFLLAAGALIFLQIEPKRPESEEPTGVVGVLSSIDWARIAPLASQIALAVTAVLTERARDRRRGRDRGRDRR
jgi:amino acid transporter